MAPTRVVNVKQEACDVYIGRAMPGRPGSSFGNPFRIGEHGSRDEVIERYRDWLLGQPKLLEELQALKGMRLGCWCRPARCHGDVLVELLEGPTADVRREQLDLLGLPDARASRPRRQKL